MIRRYSPIVLVMLIAALALSACGGGTTPAPSAKAITLDAAEFSFTPNAFTAKVGEEVTFTITNKGTLEHNFVVFDSSGAELTRTSIAVGSSATAKVKPSAAGAYEIVCDVAGHKEAGMVATLTVSE